MRSLICHPDWSCGTELTVAANAARSPSGVLEVRYVVAGRTDSLFLPPASMPSRTDGLWRHTCFEAFLCASSGGAYYEFNFAPSLQWAAYSFHYYRAGMAHVDGFAPPRCKARVADNVFELEASLDLSEMTDVSEEMTWRLGLSAVIEEKGGRISYWALSHPPGKPDFHHSDCFVLDLPKP